MLESDLGLVVGVVVVGVFGVVEVVVLVRWGYRDGFGQDGLLGVGACNGFGFVGCGELLVRSSWRLGFGGHLRL